MSKWHIVFENPADGNVKEVDVCAKICIDAEKSASKICSPMGFSKLKSVKLVKVLW